MKKRLLALVMMLSVLMSTTGLAYADSLAIVDLNTEAAIGTTTSYLEKSAYARYFYDERETEHLTIKAISEEDQTVLIQNIANYPAFRSAQAIVPYEETKLSTATLSSFSENLTLHQESIAYYGHKDGKHYLQILLSVL